MKFRYGWLLKFILAAILLGIGIYIKIETKLVYIITGVAIILFSLLRVVPLLKTLKKEVLRTVNLIEILVDTVLGVLLVYAAVSGKVEDSDTWQSLYRYFLAFVFYARALVYLTSTTFFAEKTEVPKFVTHILSITVGTYIATSKDFEPSTVALIILIISIMGFLYLSYDGFKGYKVYRGEQLKLNEGKVKETKKRKDKQIEKEDVDVIIEKDDEHEQPHIN